SRNARRASQRRCTHSSRVRLIGALNKNQTPSRVAAAKRRRVYALRHEGQMIVSATASSAAPTAITRRNVPSVGIGTVRDWPSRSGEGSVVTADHRKGSRITQLRARASQKRKRTREGASPL